MSQTKREFEANFYRDSARAVKGIYLDDHKLFGHYDREIEKHAVKWPLLKAGLFDGSLDRLKEIKNQHDRMATKLAVELGFQ